MTERKLDIFRVLSHADKKDVSFFDTLTEEEVAALQPLLVMRWLSGTKSPLQIMLLNEVVNPYIFTLTQHKQLLWNLITTTGQKQQRKYQWIKAPGKGASSKPITISLLKQHYKYSHSQAVDVLPLLCYDQVVELAEYYGRPNEDLTSIKKEWK